MTELQWPPEQIGRLTLTQLACLVGQKAVEDAKMTQADWEAYSATRRKETEEWHHS